MAYLGGSDWIGRLVRLRASLQPYDCDALVVSTPVNVRYLTGFTGSSALLVLTRDEPILITDGRYELAVREALAAGTLAPVVLERVQERYDRTLAAVLRARGLRRVGCEAAHVTMATFRAWQAVSDGIEWVPTERLVERLRMIKDEGEVATFRRAGRALSDVARELPAIVREGQSEVALARAIEDALLRAGFSGPSFPTIVASGPNSAHPHARPTERRLASGDLVLLDFGGVLDGYCVDLTRVFAIGHVTANIAALHAAVRDAQAAAIAAVRPGIDASVIDEAARSVLAARDLGEAFQHSTGHGLGLEIHEAPRIGQRDFEAPEPIRPGMVFTIEPGAYVELVGGVRLEDDVLVTAAGGEVLTDAPRDLLVV